MQCCTLKPFTVSTDDWAAFAQTFPEAAVMLESTNVFPEPEEGVLTSCLWTLTTAEGRVLKRHFLPEQIQKGAFWHTQFALPLWSATWLGKKTFTVVTVGRRAIRDFCRVVRDAQVPCHVPQSIVEYLSTAQGNVMEDEYDLHTD